MGAAPHRTGDVKHLVLRRINGDQTAETVVDGPAPAERSLSLDDLDKALQAAERELAEANADRERIPDLEAALRDLDVDERLGEVAPDVAGKRRAELEAEITIVRERPERLAGEVERLRARCIEAGEAAEREAIARWAEPLRQAKTRIADAEQVLRERHAERDRILGNIEGAKQALAQVRMRYDPDARARAQAQERYDREVARSIAQHGRWRWEKEVSSPRMLALVEEERAKLEGRQGEERQHERELAAASWPRELGEFGGSKPEFLDRNDE